MLALRIARCSMYGVNACSPYKVFHGHGLRMSSLGLPNDARPAKTHNFLIPNRLKRQYLGRSLRPSSAQLDVSHRGCRRHCSRDHLVRLISGHPSPRASTFESASASHLINGVEPEVGPPSVDCRETVVTYIVRQVGMSTRRAHADICLVSVHLSPTFRQACATDEVTHHA
jgi:hypothetical protein